jgi:hypothetical protein
MVTPLIEVAAASSERFIRAFRERGQRFRREKPARSLDPVLPRPVENPEPSAAALSIATPLIEAAAASSKRLAETFGKWNQRFRQGGRAQSPQSAVPGPVENRAPGDRALSFVTPLIRATAASRESLVRARPPQPVLPGPVANPWHGVAAPSIVTPLIEAASASTEGPVRMFREPTEPSREERAPQLSEPAAPPSVSIAEPTHMALTTAAPVTVEAAPAPTVWPKFPGDIGYADRLGANATLLAKLILMASMVGVTAAEIWRDRWPDAPVKLGPDELKTIKSEAALVCIRFIEEMADKYMLQLDKNSLMTKLQALVASALQSLHGIDAASFQPLLQARSQEYRECDELGGKEGVVGDQAFLRQGANRIAATIGIGDSPFFNDTVTNLLLKQFARWGVPDLLRR